MTALNRLLPVRPNEGILKQEILISSTKKFALLGATMLTFGAVGSAHSADLVKTAASAGNFTTLVAAVEAAGLVETLMGPGPYTVFAPTDDAFAMVSSESLEALMMPENLMHLETILKGHFVPGIMTSTDMRQALTSGQWPNSADVTIKVEDGVIMANTATLASDIAIIEIGSAMYVSADYGTMDQARIVETDIMADNGIIHVIDHVLTPTM